MESWNIRNLLVEAEDCAVLDCQKYESCIIIQNLLSYTWMLIEYYQYFLHLLL